MEQAASASSKAAAPPTPPVLRADLVECGADDRMGIEPQSGAHWHSVQGFEHIQTCSVSTAGLAVDRACLIQ